MGAAITSEVPSFLPVCGCLLYAQCALQSTHIAMYSPQSAVEHFRIHFSEGCIILSRN